MRYGRAAIVGAIGSLLLTATALADGPAAVVEDVTGKAAGVEFMDYVEVGKVIRLGPHDKIVLSYLKSCWRETITGGVITVGAEQSVVQGGNVERAQVKCNGGNIALNAEQAIQSAGVISRGVRAQSPAPAAGLTPDVVVFARIPIVDVGGAGILLIERLDQPEDRVKIKIQSGQLTRGTFFDFARANRVLAAGGVYRATFGAKHLVFRVDPSAPPMAPIVARLVRF